MFVSIDAGAQVAIILLACRPCVVIVNCLGQVLYLGRAPRTKESLPDFRECRVGYPTSTSVPRVDRLLRDTPILGRHTLPVIISASLTAMEEDKLLRVLRDHKDALGWSLDGLKGIRPSMCMHRIMLEDGH